MKTSDFFRGMCIGMAAGAAVDMVLTGSRAKKCKTAVGKTMQKMGCAVDSVAQDISSIWR